MFGMSLGEIFVIAIIAILFVGPDKLPDALVKIAKFFRSFKNTINEAKDSFEKELQINELREEALKYKKQLTSSVENIKEEANLTKLDEIYEEFNSIHKNTLIIDKDEENEKESKKIEPKKYKSKNKKDEDVNA